MMACTEIYSCVVAGAVFTSFLLNSGMVYGIGIYYVLIEEHYSAGPAQVSLLCSIFTATFFAISPVSAILTNRFGCRPVTMAGGVISCLGYVISSYVDSIKYLYFTFGIVAAGGLGLCGTPSIVIVAQHFSARRPLAYSIGLSGVGLGAVVFPQVVNFLVTRFNLQGAFLLTGGLSLHLTLCGAIFRPGKELQKEKTSNEKGPELLQLHLFTDLQFIALSVTCLLCAFGQSIVHVHIAAYTLSLGINHQGAANVISVVGITNFVGRLFFGVLPMIPRLGAFIPFVIGLLLTGVTIISITWTHSYISLCVVTGLFGFMNGCFGTLQPQTLLQAVGQGKLASGYGFHLIFIAMGSLLGASIAGLLYEATLSYLSSFYLGAAAFVGAGLCAIVPLIYKKHSVTEETKHVDEEKSMSFDDV